MGADRFEESAEELYENAPCGYVTFLDDRRIVRANRAIRHWVGLRPEEIEGRPITSILSPGGRIFFETHLAPMLSLRREIREVALELQRPEGGLRPVLVTIVTAADVAGRPRLHRASIFDATERRAYELDLLAARRRSDEMAARLRGLQRVTAAMAAALHPADLADVIAETAAEAMDVDNVVFWLRDADGATLRAVQPRRWPSGLSTEPITDARAPHWEALRSSTAVLVDQTNAHERGAWLVQRLQATGHRHVAFVPFRRSDSIAGVVSFGFRGPTELTGDDLAVLGAIAEQAGASLERAELFEQQQRIALSLQRSLLPADLPSDERVHFAGHYAPAANGAAVEVGGDWYDAVRIDADLVAIVVGDVVGRGVAAAATMGQLRSATRALLLSGIGPRRALEHLDRFVTGIPDAHCTTVACGQLHLGTGQLQYACAGHLPPLLVGEAGPVFLQGSRGIPLGVACERRPAEATRTLRPGDALYLYTDGLVERRGESIDIGLERLAAVIGGGADRSVGELATTLGPSGDDSALLRVRYRWPLPGAT